MRPNFTLNYGLRYDYYAPLRERDNRIVKFNIDTGVLDPDTTPFYKSKKNNFQPRVSAHLLADEQDGASRAASASSSVPGQTEDQIQPIEAERISTTRLERRVPPTRSTRPRFAPNFINNPNNRSYQPRAYANDYTLPEKVYQYTASVQQELGASMAASVGLRRQPGTEPVPAQRRQPDHRRPVQRRRGAARQIREFDIVTRQRTTARTVPGSTIASIQRPYAEVDYKTSGGHDSYNAMQLSLTRRSASGLSLNAQYTLGYSKGNTGGSNEAVTAGNNARALADFDYDNGYNNFDVRHTFNLSVLYTVPGKGALTGGWTSAASSTRAAACRCRCSITPPRHRLRRRARGRVWNNAGGGSHGGHQHAGRRRLAQHAPARPGSGRRSVHQGRRAHLPEPGGVRDAEAGHVRQPGAQLDSRTRLPADRPGRVEADQRRRRIERRAPRGGLQPLQHHELHQPGRHAAQRAAGRGRDGHAGQPRAARTAVHSAAPPARSAG